MRVRTTLDRKAVERNIPLTVYGDEIVVSVTTPSGGSAGLFLWPRSCLDDLRRINTLPRGFYFSWNAENDLTKATTVERFVAGKGATHLADNVAEAVINNVAGKDVAHV